MRDFFNKYKGVILPLILIIIFFSGVVLSWGKWGHVIYDCFREAVLPQAILDGKVFYRDITNLYPPLAYYFNALLYLIFGNSLNTLYWAGIVNSFIILSFVYLITKKISSHFIAFIAVLSIMEIFVFRISASSSTSSWIFPYSYSFIYAFSSCLIGLYAYILYLENKKFSYLFAAFFFAGLSVAFKLDFILFTLVPLYEAIRISVVNKTYKPVFKGILWFVAPILTGFLLYFITGGTFEALIDEAKFLNDFSKAPSVKVFNQGVLPQMFVPWVLAKVKTAFSRFLFNGTILFLYIYFSIKIITKFKILLLKVLSGLILGLIGIFGLVKYIATVQFIKFQALMDLSFVSYFVTITAILIFLIKFIKYKKLNFTKGEKIYFLLAICAWLISFRSFSLLCLAYIGNFMLVVWWIGFIYFFVELLPVYCPFIFKKEMGNKVKAALCIFFMLYPLYFVFIYEYYAKTMPYKINSEKGTIYIDEKHITTINDTLDYIEKNIPEDKNLLIAEEGLIFNYLKNRKVNLKYYALIPHMVDTYGEENIIKDLAKNPPDYIFVTNSVYVTKAGGAFGTHYAKNIAAFIVYNYDYVKTIKNPKIKDGLEITVFKLKNK